MYNSTLILGDVYHLFINVDTYRRCDIEFCDAHHLTGIEDRVILIVVKEELTKIESVVRNVE